MVSQFPRTAPIADKTLIQNDKDEAEVYQFLMEQIDSVPHLEALLLLWNTRPECWACEKLGERLYVPQSIAERLLHDLARQGLVSETDSGLYSYNSSLNERNRIIALLDARYRREVVRISTLIHSKPSSSLRDFARAFRFTKERE